MGWFAKSSFWLVIHRWFGIVTAVFLFIAAVTGCLLTVRASLDAWANSDLYTYAGEAPDRLPVFDAVSRYELAHPGIQVVGFPVNPDPSENIRINIAPRPGGEPVHKDEVFLDPATGGEIGARSTEPGWSRRQVVPLLAELHANLLAGDAGRIFMGFVALGWFISALVGLYLTFPRRRPFFRNWWSAWTYSPKRSFARQMLDMHRASALWLFPFLGFLAFTSVALNFFSEVYAPVATAIAPLEKSLFDEEMPFPEGTTPDLSFADAFQLAEAQAAEAGMEWQAARMLYLPAWNLYRTMYTDNGVVNYRHLGPVYLYFDARSGAYVHEVNPYTDSAGLVMIRVLYPTHSGEVAGGFTVFLVFILGLATAEQCITGVWVWWKKRGPRIAAKKRAQA